MEGPASCAFELFNLISVVSIFVACSVAVVVVVVVVERCLVPYSVYKIASEKNNF